MHFFQKKLDTDWWKHFQEKGPYWVEAPANCTLSFFFGFDGKNSVLKFV